MPLNERTNSTNLAAQAARLHAMIKQIPLNLRDCGSPRRSCAA